jgi:hypothetical protein
MFHDFLSPYLYFRNIYSIKLVNEEKFIEVSTLWFDYFNYTLDFIESNELDINLLDNNKLIKKSILYAFDILEGDFNTHTSEQKNILKKILSLFQFNKIGFLPAGFSNKFIDKINFKLLFIKSEYLKIEVNNDFKNAYFDFISNKFDKKIVNILNQIIPDVFFANGLAKNYNLPIILRGSPLSFFDFNYNYLKLLLHSKKVKIFGIQHGGAYGEWLNNPFENYEKRISDFYYGWGLFNDNIIQNRFKKISARNKLQIGVFWFGRNKYYVPQKVDFGSNIFENLSIVNHIQYFYTFFKEYNFKFLPHPRLSDPIYENVFPDDLFAFNEDPLTLVSNARLIIFDCLSHTLMYYCLYNKIPFIIVVDKWPIKGLSESGNKFYSMLFKKNLLLHKGDDKLITKLDFIKKYINDPTLDIYDQEFHSYVTNTFLSNKTINSI